MGTLYYGPASAKYAVLSPRALDLTEVDGVPYRVFDWLPIEWNLPVGEQIVTIILPVELPAEVTQPEQVTDDLVDRAAIIVDDANLASFDRWVYFHANGLVIINGEVELVYPNW